MIVIIFVVLALIFGYLLGSVSNGVLIGKIFYGVDIRTMGSHNAGGTNTGRVLGKKAGLITILLDILKTMIAIWATLFILRIDAIESIIVIDPSYYAYIAAVGACIGHTFPIFFNFKGGKAVACFAGLCLATNWMVSIIGFIIFMLVLLLSKYVSLGSILGSLSVAIASYIAPITSIGMVFNLRYDIYYSLLMTFLCLFVIVRHYQNIKRLIHHEENKIKWLGKH